MDAIIDIRELDKMYRGTSSSTTTKYALKNINLQIRRGEIFALLGPNGAGKTTLISIICGIVNASNGHVSIDGADNVSDYRKVRARIGLVPQELTTDAFESVWAAVSFSRGLFGKSANPQLIEQILKDLSLWDKKDARIMTLSGGMKRRLLIAKALSHEPDILFLDEPTAGVDVELRRDMWNMVRRMRERGVTVILTTHYIEEAEEMADRIGVISQGEIILVEDKTALMKKLGKRELLLHLQHPMTDIPEALGNFNLELRQGGEQLAFSFDSQQDSSAIAKFLRELEVLAIDYKDLHATQSSLEDIFVDLLNVKQSKHNAPEIDLDERADGGVQ